MQTGQSEDTVWALAPTNGQGMLQCQFLTPGYQELVAHQGKDKGGNSSQNLGGSDSMKLWQWGKGLDSWRHGYDAPFHTFFLPCEF